MKRKLIILSLYFAIAIICITAASAAIIPLWHWNRLPSTALEVWILDKTVPVPDYREHKGLMWVLNHNKIVYKQTGQPFRYNRDYFGFFPVNRGVYDVNTISNAEETPDLIYLTDTYGVYTDDYLVPNVKGTKSDLIYGGLNKHEIEIIKNNISKGNTIIGEFNIASSPTNTQNRQELGALFKTSWLGWKGRYFRELRRDIEVPVWVVENYEEQYQQKWNFTGEGFILVSDSDEIIIMEDKKHIGKNDLSISFHEQYKEEFNVSKTIPYQYWFEFLQPKPGTETIASYQLDLTEEGKRIMDELGLSTIFPAIIRNNNTQYTSYYFAGDFADFQNVSGLWNYYGYDKIKSIMSSFNKKDGGYFYWNCYVPIMDKIIGDIKDKVKNDKAVNSKDQDVKMVSMTTEKGFKVFKDDKWEDFFVKGVNIGAALPGKWFTEFPKEEEVYLSWFEKISQMNANSIRVYTLLPPAFYNALEYFNKTNPDTILWLFQEIWPEESPEGRDYLRQSYIDEYYKEIEYVIDAIHGKANIKERKGRAYGVYTSDVSSYVLGYLVGRELEPEEVITTNEKNKEFSYEGQYLSPGNKASATEAWLAMNCDYVMKYEEDTYGWQHPVAIVSWPTLDILEHDSEWNVFGDKSREYNDKVSIDINNIEISPKMKSGFFGAYHIYPNYPDFINNEPDYGKYVDEEGALRYGGYLQEFMESHSRYPALVAEFGLATGMGNAHFSPDGYNHGGLTEEQQGRGIVRMMKAIQQEGYAGGLIFEWMDEWAKKTWTTEPFMIPYERQVFWHNAIDPEQNYGILAMEPQLQHEDFVAALGKGEIQRIEMNQSAAYLHINITLKDTPDFSNQRLMIGLDTYDRNSGELRFDPKIEIDAPGGLEFLLDIQGKENSRILVHPGYNISKGKYSSYQSSKGIFEEIRPLINSQRVTKQGEIINAQYENGSQLSYGDFEQNSFNHWYVEGNKIHLRIPWGRINFSDPSQARVLNDNRNISNPQRDQLATVVTDGILLSVVMADTKSKAVIDKLNSEAPYLWSPWTDVQYKERLKDSYNIIKEYFKDIR